MNQKADEGTADEKKEEAELKRKGLWVSTLALVVSLAGLVVSGLWARQASISFDQAQADRELQWQPALSIVARLGALEDREPLGLFLENAGTGPARLDEFCTKPALPRTEIPDLRVVLTQPRPGTLLAAGEVIPLLGLVPDTGKVWSIPLAGTVVQLVGQLESKNLQISVCYRSLYEGCYRVERTLRHDQWLETYGPRNCEQHCCDASGQPVK
jgi:hypothetical protein